MNTILLILNLIAAQQPAAPRTVTAEKLYQDYKSSEVWADRKYRNMHILVDGVIQEVAISDNWMVFKTSDPHGIVAVFFDDEGKQLYNKGYKEGSRIKLNCKCYGIMLGYPMLLSCKLP